jgi:hypothetical protein
MFVVKLERLCQIIWMNDEKVRDSVDKINELLLDGFPNVKDMIEDVEKEMEELQNYMKLKKK